MKKILLFILMLILTFSAYSHSIACKEKKLPSKKEFKSKYELFLENEEYAEYWTMNWTYEKSKDQVAQELSDFDTYLSSLKTKNYETSLLHLIVKTYLYNLDEMSYDEIVDYGNALKKKYPREYRTWWIMGSFYASSSISIETYPEFETAAKMRGGLDKKDQWLVPFLIDYIGACNMAGMKIHARQGLNYLCQYTDSKAEDYVLYPLLYSEQTESSLDGTYDMYNTWYFTQIGDAYRIDSTLLGLSIPVQGNWSLRINGYENNRSFISIQSDPMKISQDKQTSVSFSIFAFAGIERSEVDMYASSSAQSNNSSITKKETVSVKGIKADSYTFENPQIYNDEREGMKGIILVFSVPYNEFSGLNIERPVDYSTMSASEPSEDGMSYFRLKPKLDRLEGDIHFFIILDACNACFDEAKAWMDSILDGCIFE